MRSRALRVRDVTELKGVVNFCKRPWMTSGQLAALFPISAGAYQPGSMVCHRLSFHTLVPNVVCVC